MGGFCLMNNALCLMHSESKMCRLALQLLGMLGNVLGRPRHALQRPRPTSACFATSSACFARSLACFARSLADLGMLLQGPRSPTSKRNPPICCLISCEAKGVVYHQVSYMEAWWCQKERGLEDSKIIALGHI